MKTTNISKTKPNESRAWFRSPNTPPGRKQVGPILQMLGPARGFNIVGDGER